MSEILKKAHEINIEQNKAKEVAETNRLRGERELAEARLIGSERAQQFVQLMIEHNVPTENFYTKVYKKRLITDNGYVYYVIGGGWSVMDLGLCISKNDTNGEDIRGLAILKDASVHKWRPSKDTKNDKEVKVINESSDDSMLLADEWGLERLGKKVVELGIIK